uniref:Uncharacterized protein n=1 Tax=Candidozyma auris TaxID=498019 RepID=A0A0L0P678_CANAR
MSIEELNKRVDELTDLVKRQSEVIAKTGKQMMEYQVKDVKARMASLNSEQPKIDTDEFATNDDLVQLVTELQGQLDYLEDRNVKRVYNSHIATDADSSTPIAPLTNKDGEHPPDFYPKTLGELRDIDAASLLQLCEFFELIVENNNPEDIAELMKLEKLSKEELDRLINPKPKTLEEKLKGLKKEDEVELFDELARFLGVRIRRGNGW